MLKLNDIYNMDCLAGMREFPDKYFDLCITDPPYGINYQGHGKYRKRTKDKCTFDIQRPDPEYFAEIMRVSKNQIIFGGNYFADLLPPSRCWLVWDKCQYGLDQSDGELIYTSFDQQLRIKKLIRGYFPGESYPMHPTQKPIKLYQWLLGMFCKPCYRIIDPYSGSGNCCIACEQYGQGVEYIGFEIDKNYYEKSKERLSLIQAQTKMF